ncbi:MAG: Integral membrane protein MviN [Parcubacteria group bacterium Gr01-1014_17]|nr:MAG: Integral membrane protein MviN [Parcubacteria group bacterium Gr01-1014_17]
MVKRLLSFFHKDVRGLHEAAYLLGAFALLSQALALLRDRLFASSFGAGELLDAYFAAFRIPDLILVGAASMVSASILIPFLVEKMEKEEDGGRRFVDSVFSAFFSSIAAVSLFAFFLTPFLVRAFFPAALVSEEFFNTTVALTKIMLLQPIFLGISNLFGSIVQARRRFFVYAISPLLYNLGIIVGIVFLYPLFGISGLAWGVVFGAALHMAVQIPVVARVGLFPRFSFSWRFSELRGIVAASLPRTMALGVSNVVTLVLLSIASSVGAGSIAIFTLAWNLQSVPLSIVGVSYSLAAFPTLVRLFSKSSNGAFLEAVSTSLKHIAFWSLPAMALFIVLRAQIVRVVLGAGAFSWTDTRLTAAALALFALSVAAQGIILLLVRAYYASGETSRPLLVNVFSGALTVALGYWLAAWFSHSSAFRFFIEALLRVTDVAGTGALALPLAYSLGALVNLALLWRLFSKRYGSLWRASRRTIFESMGSSVIAGAVAYAGLNLFDNVFDLGSVFGVLMQGLLAGALGVAAWAAVLYVLKSRELSDAWATVHHKIWRARPIAPDPAENPTL